MDVASALAGVSRRTLRLQHRPRPKVPGKIDMNRWGIPKALEQEVRARDRFCVYCGIKLIDRVQPGQSRRALATWEHIVNDASIITRENIARCCTPCNSSKGTKNLADWMQSLYCMENGIDEDSVADVVRRSLRRENGDT
jgi:5-methylcytosine-specific restriction endonuclease McrA